MPTHHVNKVSKTSPKMPAWFHQQPNATSRGRYKDATVRYIIDEKLQDKLPKPNMNLYKAILRIIKVFKRRWSDVTVENFNPNLYTAHQCYVDTIRNLINSKRELQQMLDEEDPRAEEEDNEEADWPEEEAQEEPHLGEVDRVLDQGRINTATIPPLPGSSEQRSTKATPAPPAVG